MATRWEDPSDKDNENYSVTETERTRAVQIFVTRGLERLEVEEASAGDIVWISGPKEIGIGDTFSSPELEGQALPPLDIEEPTVSMFFLVNNGPFSGQEGQAITLRQLKARLQRELHVNVALRMEDLGRPDGVKVSGRGELQLAILIEEMRREGMEFCVSEPEVITEEIGGGALRAHGGPGWWISPREYQGIVFEKLCPAGEPRVRRSRISATGSCAVFFLHPQREGLVD
jgi:Predicted membrane GTPase involved in stress response